MERPRRSTRGQKPVQSTAEFKQEQQLYESLFGEEAFEDEQVDPEAQRVQQLRQQRRDQLLKNLQNFAYVRAHHYYYPLDDFPRLEGHPSYAIDRDNIFGWTYRQNQEPLNRIFFGLPRAKRENDDKPREKEMEERLSEEALQQQQMKYGLDRMIYTCKAVARHLQQFVQTGKVAQFKGIARKEPELELLGDEGVSVREKRKLLERVVGQAVRKKEQLATKEGKRAAIIQPEEAMGLPGKRVKEN